MPVRSGEIRDRVAQCTLLLQRHDGEGVEGVHDVLTRLEHEAVVDESQDTWV